MADFFSRNTSAAQGSLVDFFFFFGQAEEDEGNGISDSQAAMLEAKIDPVEWKRELERVGPRLKVRCGASGWAGTTHTQKKAEKK